MWDIAKAVLREIYFRKEKKVSKTFKKILKSRRRKEIKMKVETSDIENRTVEKISETRFFNKINELTNLARLERNKGNKLISVLGMKWGRGVSP